MRKNYYTLSGLVKNRMRADPRNGDVYIFVNKRRNRVKLLHYETGGMVIYSKMLDRGTFGMPILASFFLLHIILHLKSTPLTVLPLVL